MALKASTKVKTTIRSTARSVVKTGVFCVTLVIAGRLSLALTGTAEGVALVWLPAGVALIGLIYIDRSLWPGVALGSFITNLTFGLPIDTALGIAAGSTLGALAGVYALQLAAFSKSLETPANAVKLNGIGATSSASVSAILGVTALHVTGLIPEEALLGAGWRWWIGDAVGVVVISSVMPIYLSVSPPD
jgi:integral membrane sensor domain MASE1